MSHSTSYPVTKSTRWNSIYFDFNVRFTAQSNEVS